MAREMENAGTRMQDVSIDGKTAFPSSLIPALSRVKIT